MIFPHTRPWGHIEIFLAGEQHKQIIRNTNFVGKNELSKLKGVSGENEDK